MPIWGWKLILDKRQATVKDNKPITNIPAFGQCNVKNGPCTPEFQLDWVNGKESTKINGVQALTEKATLVCVSGGRVKITDDGQLPKAVDANRVEDGVGKMANGGLMVFIGWGALGVGLTALTVFSAPVLVAAAAVTVIAGSASALMGWSDVFEGGQDVVFGAQGSSEASTNPLRDTAFRRNSQTYSNAEIIATTVAGVGEATLAPLAMAVVLNKIQLATEEAGAGSSLLGRSVTGSQELQDGRLNAVEETKAAEGTRTKIHHPDASIRDKLGRYAGTTGVIPGTPGVEKAMEIIKTDPKYQGYEIVGNEISVKSKDGTIRRYDIVCQKPDGTFVGVEVKSGTATRTAQQKRIDNELLNSGGLPTTGEKARKANIDRIDTVELMKVD